MSTDRGPLAAEEIIARVRRAGVRGLGGGRFDTASKLTCGESISTLLVNGMQSEPGNLSDTALFNDFPCEVAAGAVLAARACGAQAIVLALPATPRLQAETLPAFESAI